MPRLRKSLIAGSALLTFTLVFTSCSTFPLSENPLVVETIGQIGIDQEGLALDTLKKLPIKEATSSEGYSRELFGPGWPDLDRNGCDQRNDVLNRDLIDAEVDHKCRVQRGRLEDPYSGKTVLFQRGEDTSARVQIDHVVALADAWKKGASELSEVKRARLGNDPLNLVATSWISNEDKGSKDASEWLPSRTDFQCAYVARQVAVKAKYQLWVTPREYEAMHDVLETCPNEMLPTSQTLISG